MLFCHKYCKSEAYIIILVVIAVLSASWMVVKCQLVAMLVMQRYEG